MKEFFWLTLAAGIFGLVYSFSKGESDGLEITKVIYAGIVMIVLLVIWFNSGKDPLDPNKKIEVPENPFQEHPLQHKRPNYFPEPIEIGPPKTENRNRFINGVRQPSFAN